MASCRTGVQTCLLAATLLAGCSDKTKEDATKERLIEMSGGTELKAVVPVGGTVFVDEVAQSGVNLYLYDEAGKQVTDARTDKDGKYCWSTYEQCDGVPPGNYLIGFAYIPEPKKNDTGIDLFKGKYKNARSGNFKLTVEAGKPQATADYKLELAKK